MASSQFPYLPKILSFCVAARSFYSLARKYANLFYHKWSLRLSKLMSAKIYLLWTGTLDWIVTNRSCSIIIYYIEQGLLSCDALKFQCKSILLGQRIYAQKLSNRDVSHCVKFYFAID